MQPGDTVHFKITGGSFAARGTVARVLFVSGLTPAGVRSLRERFEPRVRGGAGYWLSKRHARFATILFLQDVMPCDRGPEYRGAPGYSPRAAWISLGAERRRAG